MDRGTIYNIERYKQLLDFSGLQFERKITPTDIDLFLDFGGIEFVVGEFKVKGNSVPYGQRRALNEILQHLSIKGKTNAMGIIAEHQTPPDKMINACNCWVTEYWFDIARGWQPPKEPITVRKAIEQWREWQTRKELLLKSQAKEQTPLKWLTTNLENAQQLSLLEI
jgi:hypothetical protein